MSTNRSEEEIVRGLFRGDESVEIPVVTFRGKGDGFTESETEMIIGGNMCRPFTALLSNLNLRSSPIDRVGANPHSH